jgi:hypothetical protein
MRISCMYLPAQCAPPARIGAGGRRLRICTIPYVFCVNEGMHSSGFGLGL